MGSGLLPQLAVPQHFNPALRRRKARRQEPGLQPRPVRLMPLPSVLRLPQVRLSEALLLRERWPAPPLVLHPLWRLAPRARLPMVLRPGSVRLLPPQDKPALGQAYR